MTTHRDGTIPIDISELTPVTDGKTMPIRRSQILSCIPERGTTVAPRPSWFGRMLNALKR